ncbi:acetyl-CoA carboxylase biotin carboxylase subunit [Clostridium bowmanii]|uniref:acetyl-CoA carboxylase biotin carboxylase subunit n=1 Tax=Clostridium bowmanii TaxID=132925 RepID=UPI001C0BED04|nr:acetyl-CoA carboxylase biotin carboxylase subunit [Clostridium bowmanii]MBU3188253.1 acetyl-CoA carboxylase biotin carboxylase subunit [Clostridium bowmanii]MCA1072639.1 acetyl-CoA carboxylase biotin carboxylase subunit [Clostridium bowmanii]
MFSKILIANRGEIAVRVIRACRELGIETVAVYSEIDEEAVHTQLADCAICIGPARAKDSYLNMKNIISATVLSGAEAIHPGFGFLSENAKFAEMCRECSIEFIGPTPETIGSMGNKSKARELMIAVGIPVIPGSEGAVYDSAEALEAAKVIGFPVMVKASAGGGGRGIRIVREEEEFVHIFETAKAEANGAFGDDTMYIEKFIENPRHIEFQILGDKFGNVIYLGDRDCSIQRRNQKVLEEAPSPIMTKELRKEMGEMAVHAAKAVHYENAGTIEFLLDHDSKFYFMEMNTRIQVEHPITEMITGVDLVKEQLRIAAGEKLSVTQEDIKITGHAIECRINAENTAEGFRPCPGKIEMLVVPGGPGVRIDSAVYQNYVIPPNYDSMIAKVITYGKTREDAMSTMKRALAEFVVKGIHTNIDFQLSILNNKAFTQGKYNTGFIAIEFNL